MRTTLQILAVLIFCGLISTCDSADRKQAFRSPRILAAKTAYFDNQTGSNAVGIGALARLKKWGKFQIVPDKKQADLILLLSDDPYKGGNIILSGGQTGNVDGHGHVTEDPIPDFNKASPTRYAYLTVIDGPTGDKLWTKEHVWGGLLTGFNSVGERLIGEFEKQCKR